jgi:hypothetical protein
VDQPKDIIQYLRVVRILLEADELIINRVQTLVGLGQEFAEEIIHCLLALELPGRRRRAFSRPGQFQLKAFNIG